MLRIDKIEIFILLINFFTKQIIIVGVDFKKEKIMLTNSISATYLKTSNYSVHPNNTIQHAKTETKTKIDNFSVSSDLNVNQYNANGETLVNIHSPFNIILTIKNHVDEQVKELMEHYTNPPIIDDNTKVALKEYVEENPEDLEDIEKGIIPEYWNQENTAKRIFNILLEGLDRAEDKDSFYESSKDMIEKVYSDVETEVGKLPQLVTDTKNAVLNGLDEFLKGTDISNISFA